MKTFKVDPFVLFICMNLFGFFDEVVLQMYEVGYASHSVYKFRFHYFKKEILSVFLQKTNSL